MTVGAPHSRPLAALVALGVVACSGGGTFTYDRGAPGAPAEPGLQAAFALSRDNVTLLPFRVRLAKVAQVAGVPVTDPILADLRALRGELGDYDYANNVPPDRSHSAAKLSTWVRGLRNVCGSTAMRQRYPSLPADLGQLILAAYGRRATASDQADVDAALLGLTLEEPDRYLTLCLAVLSSAEFVSR